MLLVHKDISHFPITELENDSESVWVKVFANKLSHFVASWYRPPGSTSEEFQLFREQLIGYNINIMRQSACLVFNPITVNNFASLFNCTPVGRASDSMMAPT